MTAPTPAFTPELRTAIQTLLRAADRAAWDGRTASEVALPLRAAIDAVRDELKKEATK